MSILTTMDSLSNHTVLYLVNFQLFLEDKDESVERKKPSDDPNLTDREKLQLFVKELGDPGLLNEFLPTNYIPAREMRQIMEYYQYRLAKDFLKIKRAVYPSASKLTFAEGKSLVNL